MIRFATPFVFAFSLAAVPLWAQSADDARVDSLLHALGMPEMIEGMLARQGIKRVGEAQDIADAVLFLTSPAASWITGQTLAVDGGFSTAMA